MPEFPTPLTAYPPVGGGGILHALAQRVEIDPFNAIATSIFVLALLHTFLAPRLTAQVAHSANADVAAVLPSPAAPPTTSARRLLAFAVVVAICAAALVAYWAVPERNKTAKHGRFRPGPRADLFRAAEHILTPLVGKAHLDAGNDVIGGAAGAIPMLLTMAEQLPSAVTVETALALGEHLLRRARRGCRHNDHARAGKRGRSWRPRSPRTRRHRTFHLSLLSISRGGRAPDKLPLAPILFANAGLRFR